MRQIIALLLALASLVYGLLARPGYAGGREQPKETRLAPVTVSTTKTDERPATSQIKAKVTAYNSVPWQTDDTPCIAANGENICELLAKGDRSCAAALPFGTKLDIPKVGICTVRDRLAKRFSNRVDVYMGGKDQIKAAQEWGVQSLTITVLYE